MAVERRKDRRHPFHLKVVLTSGRTDIATQTTDVSFKGVFVRASVPLPERHLLRVRFTLPPDGDELSITGMVARNVPTPAGESPGVGIQFYGASPAVLARWNRFIRFVTGSAPEPPAAAVPGAAPPTPDAIQRRHPRYAATLLVHIQSTRDLEQIYTYNVSKGGLFVGTTLNLPVGTALRIAVVHPKSGDSFPMDAVVRWQAPPPRSGLGLEFTGLDDARRDEFFEFVRSEIPVENFTYVADDHPHLVHSGPHQPDDSRRK